jgi:translation initiation factor 4E
MSEQHKLNDSWSMYYAPRGKRSKYDTKNYGGNLNEIGKFDNLQDFYKYYCYLKRPSAIPIDSKIMMFRSGFKPMWEVNMII